MAPKKTTLVQRPEDAPEFRALVDERQKILEKRDEDWREWSRARARLDELGGLQAVMDRSSPAWEEVRGEQQKLYKLIAQVEEASPAAKRRLKEIDDELSRARQRAARAISDKVRPRVAEAIRVFLKAELARWAEQIPPAVDCMEIVHVAEARRVGLRVSIPHAMAHSNARFSRLRADVEQAIADGVISRSDVPKAIAETWGI